MSQLDEQVLVLIADEVLGGWSVGGRMEGTRTQVHRSLECLQAVAREGVRERANRGVDVSEEIQCTVRVPLPKEGWDSESRRKRRSLIGIFNLSKERARGQYSSGL